MLRVLPGAIKHTSMGVAYFN